MLTINYSAFTESNFIGCIMFGYTSFRVWGNDKPDKEMAVIWYRILQPLFFGGVGA